MHSYGLHLPHNAFYMITIIRLSMSTKNSVALILYIIGLILAIASLVMSYTGLPENYDTEPIIAFALFLVAIAGIASIRN